MESHLGVRGVQKILTMKGKKRTTEQVIAERREAEAELNGGGTIVPIPTY